MYVRPMWPPLLAQDEFGEPTKITCVAQAGQQLEKGDKLLDIHWEGFQRTASDELYHAVWVRMDTHLPWHACPSGTVDVQYPPCQ